MSSPPHIAQLLRLASPALPIGAFAWSGGLEGAIENGQVTAATAQRYLEDLILLGHARWDAPILWRLLHATDPSTLDHWNTRYLASRETKELRHETTQLGRSLITLLTELGHEPQHPTPPTLPLAWALASHHWLIPASDSLMAWLVATLEGQLAVLQKALPLGQVAAQRLFSALLPTLDSAHHLATSLPDTALSSSLPALAITSSRHETQYSRLFRS